MTEDGQNPSEVERILRELAERETGDDLPAPGDERLRAYREGRLDAGESRELEALLARSAAGRRRLLELAGVDHTLPLRRVRKAVLAGGVPRRRTFSSSAWAAAAAAAILVATLSTLFLHTGGAPGRGGYEVAARGLAEVRSGDPAPSPAAGTVRAHAGTLLRIAVRARQEEAPSGVSFALFRRGGGFLRRVPAPAEVRVESERGSATFTGEAGRVLATRVPGVYPLYVVVSTAGEPPAEVPLAAGGDAVAVLQSAGHLVYPLTVRLLADEPPAKETKR